VVHGIGGPSARTVALHTVQGEHLSDMVWISGAGVIPRVALVAILIGERIVSVHMTLGTWDRCVGTCQREHRRRVVERCALPRDRGMAGEAGGREVC